MIEFKKDDKVFHCDWIAGRGLSWEAGHKMYTGILPNGLKPTQDLWAGAVRDPLGALWFVLFKEKVKVVKVGLSLYKLWDEAVGSLYNCPEIPVFCVNGQHARPLSLLYKESSMREIKAFCLNNDPAGVPEPKGSKTVLREVQKEALKEKEVEETTSILSRMNDVLDRKNVPNPLGHGLQEAYEKGKAFAIKGTLIKDDAYALAQAVQPKKKLAAKRTLTETMGSRWVEVVEQEPERFWPATAQALSTEDLVSELLRRSMHHPQVQSFFDASLPWFQSVRIGDGAHVHVQQVVKGPDGEAWRVVDLAPDKIYACPCHRVAPPKAFNPKNLTSWS